MHSGIISGAAPHSTVEPRELKAVLTDFNTGGGFSGSPLFDPKSGRVIGIHHSGAEGLFGIGMPLDEDRVRGWIDFVKTQLKSGKLIETGIVTGGGDLQLQEENNIGGD